MESCKEIAKIALCETECRNCGAQIAGRYCHDCGQDVFTGMEQPLKEFVARYWKRILRLATKYLITLKYLVFCPGFLTKEYCAGRIKKYVHPTQLFWVSTIVFFTLNINLNQDNYRFTNEQDLIPATTTQELEITENNIKEKETEKEIDQSDAALKYFTKAVPFAAFMLIPVFALLLSLFFRSNKIFYVHHIVFATHFHAFLWINFILYFLLKSFGDYPFFILVFLGIITYSLPSIYTGIAIHRFYQPKAWWITAWKTIVISMLYFISIIGVVYFLLSIFILIMRLIGVEINNFTIVNLG